MIAIVYARVSTEDQAKEGYSLPSQIEACRSRAVSLGYRPDDVMEFSDEGISGEILERPGLSRARELIRRGGVGHFVCLDPDRFSRKLTHQLLLTEEIERAGAQLEFINFDWQNTPEGRLFYSLRGAIAEYEKEKIKERTMRGKRQKAKEGKLTHDPKTFGYVYDRDTSSYHVHEANAALIRQMFEWCATEGMGPRAIVDRLNEMGIPSPKGARWQRITVRRILRNQTYIGELTLQKYNTIGVKGNRYRKDSEKVRRSIHPEDHWVRIPVPQIVTREVWNRAQEVLDAARRQRPGRAKVNYLLSGLCVCGLCRSTIHGNLSGLRRGTNKKGVAYYCCTRRTPGVPGTDKCTLPYIRADRIEAEVWERVRNWLLHPETLHEEWKAQQRSLGPDPTADTRTRLDQQMAEIARERARLLNLYQKALAPAEELEARLGELATREQRLKVALASLTARPTRQPVPPLASLRRVMMDVAAHLDEMDFESRREKVRWLVAGIVVYPDHIVIEARIPPEVLDSAKLRES